MTEGNKNYTETEIMLGALDRVIREEMKKRPSKRDNKLIDECIVEMAKLKNVRTGYTEEEIGAIVEQIEAKAAKKTERVPVRRKSVRRMAAVVCAACLIMAGSVAAVAWNPFEVMIEWIYNITNTPSGTVEKENGVTYTNHGNHIKYNNIQDLLENEKLKIYYPSVLPETIVITRVERLVIDKKDYVIIHFNDPDISFTIQFNESLNLYMQDYEVIKTNETTFYLSKQDNKHIARCSIDSTTYYLESYSYQDVLLMINNFIKGY